ncbi:MAG: hypothetical protein WA137_02120 [Methanothrix sp.]
MSSRKSQVSVLAVVFGFIPRRRPPDARALGEESKAAEGWRK